MPETFSYKVRDKAGKLVEGQLEAENAQLVVSKLRSMGYVPIEIQQQGGGANLQRELKIPGLSDRVKLKDKQKVNVTLYSFQGQPMVGTVWKIYPQANADRRTFEVRGELYLRGFAAPLPQKFRSV